MSYQLLRLSDRSGSLTFARTPGSAQLSIIEASVRCIQGISETEALAAHSARASAVNPVGFIFRLTDEAKWEEVEEAIRRLLAGYDHRLAISIGAVGGRVAAKWLARRKPR